MRNLITFKPFAVTGSGQNEEAHKVSLCGVFRQCVLVTSPRASLPALQYELTHVSLNQVFAADEQDQISRNRYV